MALALQQTCGAPIPQCQLPWLVERVWPTHTVLQDFTDLASCNISQGVHHGGVGVSAGTCRNMARQAGAQSESRPVQVAIQGSNPLESAPGQCSDNFFAGSAGPALVDSRVHSQCCCAHPLIAQANVEPQSSVLLAATCWLRRTADSTL
jgi:hypothetical protein